MPIGGETVRRFTNAVSEIRELNLVKLRIAKIHAASTAHPFRATVQVKFRSVAD